MLMQLIKSLFCFRGEDQPLRFALVNLSLYVAFLLFKLLFADIFMVFVVVLLLLFLLSAASAIRRIKDAGLDRYWAAVPVLVFVLCSVAITLIEHGSVLLLLLLPLGVTLALMRYPDGRKADYTLGYCGPVDLTAWDHHSPSGNQYAERVEPTLFSGKSIAAKTDDADPGQTPQKTSDDNAGFLSSNPPWGGSLKALLSTWQRLSLIMAGLLLLLTFIAVTWSLSLKNKPLTVVEQTPPATEQVRLHALEMPNNYWLMQDENQGVIIHWPSYDPNNDALWSILTAKGETSCRQIVFNTQASFRTNRVVIAGDGDYYASFSPLDSKALINAIADKRDFSLCGYEFSLTGSRAALDSSAVFSAYL